MISVDLTDRLRYGRTLVSCHDFQLPLQQADDLIPSRLRPSDVAQSAEGAGLVPIDRDQLLVAIRGQLGLGKLLMRQLGSLSQKRDSLVGVRLDVRPGAKPAHQVRGPSLRPNERHALCVRLEWLRVELQGLGERALGAAHIGQMISVPACRAKAQLVQLTPVEISLRRDLVDQSIEIGPTPGQVGKTFERIEERAVTRIGPHRIPHRGERFLRTANVVFPNRGGLCQKSHAIGIGRRQLDPLLVEPHHLFEVTGAPVVLLEQVEGASCDLWFLRETSHRCERVVTARILLHRLLVCAERALEVTEVAGAKPALPEEERRSVGIPRIQAAGDDLVQPVPLLGLLKKPIQGLECRLIVAQQRQRSLVSIDRPAEIPEFILTDPRDALIQNRAPIRVEARSRFREHDLDQLRPPLQARSKNLCTIENLVVIGPLADRLQQGIEGRVRILAPLLVHLRQSDQLLGLFVRVGHRIGAKPEQRREVAPALLGPEIRLEHRGRVFAIVSELGDAKQCLHRGLVGGIDPENLAVHRNGAQLVVELPLHDVAELVGELYPLGLACRRVCPTLQHLDELLPLPLPLIKTAQALQGATVPGVRLDDGTQCITGGVGPAELSFVQLREPHAHLDPNLGILLELHSALEYIGQPLRVVGRGEEAIEGNVRSQVVWLLARGLLIVRNRPLRIRELFLPDPAESAEELGAHLRIVSAIELLLVNPRKSFPITHHDLETLQVIEGSLCIGIGLENPAESLDGGPGIPELTVLGFGNAPQERASKRRLVGRRGRPLEGLDVGLPTAKHARQAVDLGARGLVNRLRDQGFTKGVERLLGVAAALFMQARYLPPSFGPLEGVRGLPRLGIEDLDQRLPVAALPMNRLEDLNGPRAVVRIFDET